MGLVLLLSLTASGLASPLDSRQEGCNQDNLLRALLNPTRTAEATDFCNSQLCRFGKPVRAPLFHLLFYFIGCRTVFGSADTSSPSPFLGNVHRSRNSSSAVPLQPAPDRRQLRHPGDIRLAVDADRHPG